MVGCSGGTGTDREEKENSQVEVGEDRWKTLKSDFPSRRENSYPAPFAVGLGVYDRARIKRGRYFLPGNISVSPKKPRGRINQPRYFSLPFFSLFFPTCSAHVQTLFDALSASLPATRHTYLLFLSLLFPPSLSSRLVDKFIPNLYFYVRPNEYIYICMYLWSKRFYLLRYYIAILKVSRTFFLSHLFEPKFESFELQTLLHGIHN